MNFWNKLCWTIVSYFSRWANPYQEDMVFRLILNCASLELQKDQHAILAPLPGMCGPVKLSGNSLPVFEYVMFEKSIMEFILVRVEISKPDRIEFISSITSTTAPERHGELVTTTDRYRGPFFKLAKHLYHYFPLTSGGALAHGHIRPTQTQKTVQGQSSGLTFVRGANGQNPGNETA